MLEDVGHTYEELKERLKYLPDEKMYLLQARSVDGVEWKYVWRRQFSLLTLDFGNMKEIRKFFLDIKQESYNYRIVKVSRYLNEGEIKPLAMEVVEILKA